MAISLIYTTISSTEEAEKLINSLFEERLVACVNLIHTAQSYYMWDEQMQQEEEVIVLMKTDAQKVAQLTSRLERLHPYECPAVLSFDANTASQAFSRWISNEVNLKSS